MLCVNYIDLCTGPWDTESRKREREEMSSSVGTLNDTCHQKRRAMMVLQLVWLAWSRFPGFPHTQPPSRMSVSESDCTATVDSSQLLIFSAITLAFQSVPKGNRIDLRASKIPKFSWGTMPPDPPSNCTYSLGPHTKNKEQPQSRIRLWA